MGAWAAAKEGARDGSLGKVMVGGVGFVNPRNWRERVEYWVRSWVSWSCRGDAVLVEEGISWDGLV